MRGHVAARANDLDPFTDDLVAAHNHRADGGIAVVACAAGKVEAGAHVALVRRRNTGTHLRLL